VFPQPGRPGVGFGKHLHAVRPGRICPYRLRAHHRSTVLRTDLDCIRSTRLSLPGLCNRPLGVRPGLDLIGLLPGLYSRPLGIRPGLDLIGLLPGLCGRLPGVGTGLSLIFLLRGSCGVFALRRGIGWALTALSGEADISGVRVSEKSPPGCCRARELRPPRPYPPGPPDHQLLQLQGQGGHRHIALGVSHLQADPRRAGGEARNCSWVPTRLASTPPSGTRVQLSAASGVSGSNTYAARSRIFPRPPSAPSRAEP